MIFFNYYILYLFYFTLYYILIMFLSEINKKILLYKYKNI